MFKKFLALIFLLPTVLFSQDYIDAFKLGLNHNFSSYFEDTDFSTTVNSIDFSAMTNTKRFENDGFHIGTEFFYYKVQLFPNRQPVNLYSTTLILGYTTELSDRLTAVFRLLPKLASDYEIISTRDLYFGASVLLKSHESRRKHFRYGLQVSNEAYGLFTTPIVGVYYMSNNNDFEADIYLPFSADINYKLRYYSIGAEYRGFNRSFRIYKLNEPDVYAEQRRAEFSAYFKLRTLSRYGWAKAKIGYAFNSLAVYDTKEKIDFYFIDFALRNNRRQLNPDLLGSLFFQVELIYRIPYK